MFLAEEDRVSMAAGTYTDYLLTKSTIFMNQIFTNEKGFIIG